MAGKRILVTRRDEILAAALSLEEAELDVTYGNIQDVLTAARGWTPSKSALSEGVKRLRADRKWKPRWTSEAEGASGRFARILKAQADHDRRERERVGTSKFSASHCASLDEWRKKTRGLI